MWVVEAGSRYDWCEGRGLQKWLLGDAEATPFGVLLWLLDEAHVLCCADDGVLEAINVVGDGEGLRPPWKRSVVGGRKVWGGKGNAVRRGRASRAESVAVPSVEEGAEGAPGCSVRSAPVASSGTAVLGSGPSDAVRVIAWEDITWAWLQSRNQEALRQLCRRFKLKRKDGRVPEMKRWIAEHLGLSTVAVQSASSIQSRRLKSLAVYKIQRW